jgi:hypothetical protein
MGTKNLDFFTRKLSGETWNPLISFASIMLRGGNNSAEEDQPFAELFEESGSPRRRNATGRLGTDKSPPSGSP